MRQVTTALLLTCLVFAGCGREEKRTAARNDGTADRDDTLDFSLDPNPGGETGSSLEDRERAQMKAGDLILPIGSSPSKAEPDSLEIDATMLRSYGGDSGAGGGRGGRQGLVSGILSPAVEDPAASPDSDRDNGKDGKPGEGEAKSWKRSQVVPNTSRLTIGDKEELPLRGMQVDVRIDGFRARVLLDCYYYHAHERQLEGRFQLRLPNGASPYYFAFGETRYKTPSPKPQEPQFFTATDVRGAGSDPAEILKLRSDTWPDPKEARIVPKEKAAHAYGETVRRRVDPALVEWSGAGVFSSRVFPLMPQKLHRIVIGYDVDLLPVGNGLEYRLDLPETKSDCVVDLSLAAVEGTQLTIKPTAELASINGRAAFRFDRPAERTITARITNPGPILLKGNGADVGAFFATTFTPKLPDVPAAGRPEHGVFLVDVSLSSNPERFNVWLKLLRAVLEKNRQSMRQFAVLFFNVESFWWQKQFLPNTPENVAALMDYAQRLSLEGATDLGQALSVAASPEWHVGNKSFSWDLFLLSDSAATWGERDPYALSKLLENRNVGSLFAYATGFSGTDARMMAHLARETGGAMFSVVGEAEVAKAAIAHRSRPWELAGVKIAGGDDLLLAGRPKTLFPGQRLLLVGRGSPKAGAEVVLTVRQGRTKQVVRTPLVAALPSELAPRTYGQVAVNQLEDFAAATEEFATAYARQFRVAGRTCSLLMLETEEDYKRFNIKPEEDALVVKQQPAAAAIEGALDELHETLGDSKATFLAQLYKLEKLPGVEFKVSTAFRLTLEKMPKESFAVAAPPLVCQGRAWADVPGNLQEQLAARELTYDGIAAEAKRRFDRWGADDGLRALSSLVENRPGDIVLARDVAFSAMQWQRGGQAYHLFRRTAVWRPYEPHTYHAMARCLEELGNADLALAYYEVARLGSWRGRYGDFAEIVAWDYLRFLRRVAEGQLKTSVPDYAAARLKSVAEEIEIKQCDLVVTIGWNTDRTDVDLHVIDPAGEECYYSHPRTRIGGRLTRDVTEGYGPEMFTLPQAAPGKYRIRVKYFASDINRATTRTKVYATIYERWGTKDEKVTRKVVTLTTGEEMHDIATIVK